MGSRGDAFDNAACESCVSTLKAIEDEIDRRSAPPAMEDGRLRNDLGVPRPWILVTVAVDARCCRPGRAGLKNQATLERQTHEVGQPAIRLRIARNNEHRAAPDAAAHAAAA
jgi:hypothetical protein